MALEQVNRRECHLLRQRSLTLLLVLLARVVSAVRGAYVRA